MCLRKLSLSLKTFPHFSHLAFLMTTSWTFLMCLFNDCEVESTSLHSSHGNPRPLWCKFLCFFSSLHVSKIWSQLAQEKRGDCPQILLVFNLSRESPSRSDNSMSSRIEFWSFKSFLLIPTLVPSLVSTNPSSAFSSLSICVLVWTF